MIENVTRGKSVGVIFSQKVKNNSLFYTKIVLMDKTGLNS